MRLVYGAGVGTRSILFGCRCLLRLNFARRNPPCVEIESCSCGDACNQKLLLEPARL